MSQNDEVIRQSVKSQMVFDPTPKTDLCVISLRRNVALVRARTGLPLYSATQLRKMIADLEGPTVYDQLKEETDDDQEASAAQGDGAEENRSGSEDRQEGTPVFDRT